MSPPPFTHADILLSPSHDHRCHHAELARKRLPKALFPKSLGSLAIRLLLDSGDMMANVSLDAPTAAFPKPRSQNFYAQNGKPSAGASQNDVLLISSDDESDYGHFEEDQSDTSFPSLGELSLPGRHQGGKFCRVVGSAYLNPPTLGESLR